MSAISPPIPARLDVLLMIGHAKDSKARLTLAAKYYVADNINKVDRPCRLFSCHGNSLAPGPRQLRQLGSSRRGRILQRENEGRTDVARSNSWGLYPWFYPRWVSQIRESRYARGHAEMVPYCCIARRVFAMRRLCCSCACRKSRPGLRTGEGGADVARSFRAYAGADVVGGLDDVVRRRRYEWH